MDSGPAGGSKIRERKETGRESVKHEEGKAPRFYEPGRSGESVADGRRDQAGDWEAGNARNPGHSSHAGSVDFRSAIDTELGRRSQEDADVAKRAAGQRRASDS